MDDVIVHHPLILRLAGVTVSGYGVAMVLAFAVAWRVIARECERRREDQAFALEIIVAIAFGALFGSRISYAVLAGGPLLTSGAHTFWGGVVGGACGYWLWTALRRFAFTRFADAIGAATAGGYAVGRTGCWAVGDDYGIPWNSRFAVTFPEGSPPTTAANMWRLFSEPSPPGTNQETLIAVHPTQLYEVALGLAMFLILWRMRRHHHTRGWLFGLYCVMAGLERFGIEFVRAKPERLTIGLSAAQVISLFAAALGACILRVQWKRFPSSGSTSVGSSVL